MVKIPLNRESILRGDMRKIAENLGHPMRLMTDAERNTWLDSVMAAIPDRCICDDLWIFGYGSLIWNPAFHFDESRVARVHGYHRRFCLWTYLGRGSPELPGLMLGLDNGGSCTGVGYRIEKDKIRSELDIVFRRELLSHAYIPTWVNMRFADGGNHQGITFVMDKLHERYAGELDQSTQVHHIANAVGPLGPNKEYLFDLVEHLDQLGLHDRSMALLAKRVRSDAA